MDRQGSRPPEFTEARWHLTLRRALDIEEMIARHSAIMDRYDPTRRVGLVVDEWGAWYDPEPGTNPGFHYQQNTLRDALVAALHFHIFHRHAGRVTMANIAQTVNVLQAMILTDGAKMIVTPTYRVFEMYRVHQGATALPVVVQSPDYAVLKAAGNPRRQRHRLPRPRRCRAPLARERRPQPLRLGRLRSFRPDRRPRAGPRAHRFEHERPQYLRPARRPHPRQFHSL